jgi:hypothetical protein
MLFLPVLAVSFCACQKSASTVTPTTPVFVDTAITDTTVYIDITLDNNRILGIQNTSSGPYAWYAEWGGPIADSTTYPYNRLGASFVSNASKALYPCFGFSKGNISNTLTLERPYQYPSNFGDSFFVAGNYTYSVRTHDTAFNYLGAPPDTVTSFTHQLKLLTVGVNLFWQDSTGTIWQTINGAADQTGSHFTITENQPAIYNQVTGNYQAAYIGATFDCKLYDNSGRVMHLTNGRFRQLVMF